MITVIIVDDEPDARQLLRQYIDEVPDFQLLAEATDGPEAIRLINNLTPDLVFLDVRMPGLNGFDVLPQLNELPRIIFSTAYDQYAIRAFEVHALDYLLKPYGRQRFQAAINRVTDTKALPSLTEKLLRADQQKQHRVILQKGTRRLIRDARNITYVTALGDYCRVHFKDDTLLANSGISALNEKFATLPFLRVHRSALVNMDHARELVRKGRYWYLLVGEQEEVKVSESYLPQVRKLLI